MTLTFDHTYAKYSVLDPICWRICALWLKIPDDIMDSASRHDIAAWVAPRAYCSTSEAMARIAAMESVEIIDLEGGLDPVVYKRIEEVGARMLGVGDELLQLDEGKEEEDDDEAYEE